MKTAIKIISRIALTIFILSLMGMFVTGVLYIWSVQNEVYMPTFFISFLCGVFFGLINILIEEFLLKGEL